MTRVSARDYFDDLAANGETAELLGEWWMERDSGGTVVRMRWAGGREMYERACVLANEKFGMTPLAIPLSAFLPDEPFDQEAEPRSMSPVVEEEKP